MAGFARFLPFCWIVMSLVLVASVAWGLESSPVSTGYSASIDLEQYESAQVVLEPEHVSAPLMVILAYGLMWLAALAFVWLAWRKVEALAQELRSARDRLSLLEERMEGDHRSPEGT